MIQLGGFLGRIHGPLMKVCLSLMKNIIKPLTKSLLISLRLTAAASATDAAIQNSKKFHGYRYHDRTAFSTGTTALIISNEEMEYIMKIVKALEESGLVIKGTSEVVENDAKKIIKGGWYYYY